MAEGIFWDRAQKQTGKNSVITDGCSPFRLLVPHHTKQRFRLTLRWAFFVSGVFVPVWCLYGGPATRRGADFVRGERPSPTISPFYLFAKGETSRRSLSYRLRAHRYDQPRRVFYCRGGEMSVRPLLGMWVVAAIGSIMLTPASADNWRDGGEWKDEYRDGPCKVKIESKRDEYKKEVKCDDDD